MKPLDLKWLLQCSDDAKTSENIVRIDKWRKQTQESNSFIDDDSEFVLNFNGLSFNFKVSSAFSTIETYQEIFKYKNHFLLDEFIPSGNQIILDIGANQGFYSICAKEYAPDVQIFAFEPNPFEFKMLEANLTLNGIDGVSARNVALSGVCGKVELEIIPQIGPIGGKSLKIPERQWLKDEFIKKIEVDAVTLDTIIEENELERVDILKIDVEGAEFEILSTCQLVDRVEKVVLEYHSNELKIALIELLEGRGFSKVFEDFADGDYYGDLYFIRD